MTSEPNLQFQRTACFKAHPNSLPPCANIPLPFLFPPLFLSLQLFPGTDFSHCMSHPGAHLATFNFHNPRGGKRVDCLLSEKKVLGRESEPCEPKVNRQPVMAASVNSAKLPLTRSQRTGYCILYQRMWKLGKGEREGESQGRGASWEPRKKNLQQRCVLSPNFWPLTHCRVSPHRKLAGHHAACGLAERMKVQTRPFIKGKQWLSGQVPFQWLSQ